MRLTKDTALGLWDSIDGPLGEPTAQDLTDFANAVAAHVLHEAADLLRTDSEGRQRDQRTVNILCSLLRTQATITESLLESDRRE